jgi:tetratricopeptide (TPR) repeat protein
MNVGVLTLFLLLLPPGQGSYDIAVKAFQQAQFETVLSVLASLPAAEAHRPAVFNLRAVTLMKLHRFDEAITASEQAASLDPGNANYAYNVGLMYLEKGDLHGAENNFHRSLQRFPRSSKLHLGWGETLFSMKRFKEAEDEFRKAVELDPSSADAEIGIAKLCYAIGDHERFGAAATNAIHLDPQNSLACYYYGKHLIEDQKDLTHGAECIRRSIALAPDFVQGLIEWGEILSRAGRWDEAAETYEKALDFDRDNVQVCYLLYKACRKSGRAEKAEWALRKYQAMSKNPD